MAFVADDPWAEAGNTNIADDPWAEAEQPENEAKVMWAGRPVGKSAVSRVAQQHGVDEQTIMRLGTIPGQIEARLANTEAGSLAMRLTEGIAGVGETIGAAAARAAGREDIASRIHEGRRQRQEWLSFIEKGGAVEEALGKRGARVFNQTVQSLGEIGTVGALTGPTGIYSYTIGSAWENGLDEGEREGLYGAELVGHAGRSAVIEGGLTYMMGRIPGVKSLEESFSPAASNAVRSFLRSPSMKEKLTRAAKELGGWTAEGAEEMMIAGGLQLNEMSSNMRDGFDWAEILEAGASGVSGRGAVGAIKGLQNEIEGFQQKMPKMFEGIRAAELDMERGVNPFEVKDIDDAAEFEKQTGRKNTTPEYRDSYREALNFYIAEMRREGKTGALARMEEDVKKLREEERQRAARIKASKQAAPKKSKGRAGESQVKTEPVPEPPTLTANERATFSVKEFESNMVLNDPKYAPVVEMFTKPEPKPVNPYILAPWESETRVQRTVRTLRRTVAEQKDRLKSLRQQAQANKRLSQQQQQDALSLIQENVPNDEQHGFFKGVLAATRPRAINKLLDRVNRHVENRDRNLAIRDLRESLKKAKNLRPEFAELVKNIKSSVDLKRFNSGELARTLRYLTIRNPSMILTPSESALLDRLEQQNVHGMTADDIRELGAKVESLVYQSATKDRLIYNEQSASLRDTGDRLAASIMQAPRKEMKADSLLGGDATKRTLGSQFLHEVAERPEATLLQLSPELNVELYDKTREARGEYKRRKFATQQVIGDALKGVGLDHEDSLQASVARAVGLPSTKLENWRTKKRKISGVELTRGEAFWLALSSRDPQALENMMEGGVELSNNRKFEKIDGTTLKDLFDFIGQEGEALVDVAFEHLNTYIIDGVNATNEKLTGRPLTDKKNVVPMFKADEEYAKFLTTARGMGEAVADSYSHLKHREGGIGALKIPDGMDGIDMLMGHADRMHRFAAYAPQARNAEMILNDGPVKEAIIAKNGEQGYEQIVDAVRAEVAGYPPPDALSKKLAAANHAVAGALIGGKLSIMMAQPLDTIVSAAYEPNGLADLAAAAGELTARGPAAVFKEMKEFLSASSGEWNGRYESGAYSGEITNGIFKQRSAFRPSSIVEHAADPIKLTEQAAVALPNYLAAKAAARRQLGLASNDYSVLADDPGWRDAVVSGWERKTVRGSNSSDGMELSSSLRFAKKNPLAGLVLNFYNTAGKVYSLFTMAQGEFRRGNTPGAVQFAAAGAASTMLFSALQAALSTGEKDKEKLGFWSRMMVRTAKNLAGLHPAALGATETIINKAVGLPAFEENPILLSKMISELGTSTVELGQIIAQGVDESDDPDKTVKALMDFGRVAGPLMGLPTPAAIDIAQRVQKGSLFPGLLPAEKKSRKKRSLMQGAI